MTTIGIDFGTTNTVVAAGDSTGCQVVHHQLALSSGELIVQPTYPSMVALSADGRTTLYGLEAEQAGRRASTRVLRSIKRHLGRYHEGAHLFAGDQKLGLRETMTGLARDLRRSVLAALELSEDEELDVVATVPANANGAQRWLTRTALQDGGWGQARLHLLDEPTAAALEYARRALRRRDQRKGPSTVLVYDLGGGTFDASLLRLDGQEVEVLASAGIDRLGGDDFDAELEALAVESLGLDVGSLTPLKRRNLRAECRRVKESLSAYPRMPGKVLMSLGDLGIQGPRGSDAQIPIDAYSARLDSYVARTLAIVDEVTAGRDEPDQVYLVGGATQLPLITEKVAAKLPRVLRASRPFESVAVGAATSGELGQVHIQDRLARHFGIVRVGERHEHEYVDVLFPRGSRLPKGGQAAVVRRGPYRPYFDVGVLQFLECGALDELGMPSRNRRDWRTVRFPYDPRLSSTQTGREPSRHDDLTVQVTEEYLLDSDGVVSVRIRREPDGYVEHHDVWG